MKLAEVAERLAAAGIESARHDARELFCAFGGYSGYIPPDAECDTDELSDAVSRREKREPLQYIVGKVGFYREEYMVNESVLIPRADTEHLVDYAVKHIPEGESFIDLCTGSGCVAISTLKNTTDTTATAIDISQGALEVARENARLNGVFDRITVKEGNVLEPLGEPHSYFAVLSNPPYVTEAAYAELAQEIYREPRLAFVGGEDGGDFYRAIIPEAQKMIKPEGFIALEIGYDQRELILALAAAHGMRAEIIRDYSGNDRVAVLRPL